MPKPPREADPCQEPLLGTRTLQVRVTCEHARVASHQHKLPQFPGMPAHNIRKHARAASLQQHLSRRRAFHAAQNSSALHVAPQRTSYRHAAQPRTAHGSVTLAQFKLKDFPLTVLVV